MSTTLFAGSATVDVTPDDSQFLFGYPHVPRYSTGIHDPLLSSALFLSDGATKLLWVASDVIFIPRGSAERVRSEIERETGIPAANIMLTATHTHSGPITADMISNESDPVVPKTDRRYLAKLEAGLIAAAVQASTQARPAEAGLAVADGACVGTNRHNPAGPSNPEVPVLVARDRRDGSYVAAMLVVAMHPTVLHEDSTLLSGDFPASTRQYLQGNVLGPNCPIVYHTGPCGNQSPRHVTRENTFAEAQRLGRLLGQSVARAIERIEYSDRLSLGSARAFVDLPPRTIPSIDVAMEKLQYAKQRLERLRSTDAPRAEVRTAECDWFGAEETVALARAVAAGRTRAIAESLTPAEVHVMHVGPWAFVGWPGECYVEFALEVKRQYPNACVIALVNGELQGYLVTEEAVREGHYEALNALFASPESGNRLVKATIELLRERKAAE